MVSHHPGTAPCWVSLVHCLALLMAVLYDVTDRTLTYYSNNWLVIGLYICPAIIGLVLPSTLYHTFKPNVREAR